MGSFSTTLIVHDPLLGISIKYLHMFHLNKPMFTEAEFYVL